MKLENTRLIIGHHGQNSFCDLLVKLSWAKEKTLKELSNDSRHVNNAIFSHLLGKNTPSSRYLPVSVTDFH